MDYAISHIFDNELTRSRFIVGEGENLDRLRRHRNKQHLSFDVGNGRLGSAKMTVVEKQNEIVRKLKMQREYWAVLLVNPKDTSDRSVVSSIFDNERDALDCAENLNRIVKAAVTVVETEGAAKVVVATAEQDLGIVRAISLEDV